MRYWLYLFLLAFSLLSWQYASAQTNSLHFDGVNDRAVGPVLPVAFNPAVTVEAWIRADNFNGSVWNHTILSNEHTNSKGFALRCGDNGNLSFVIGVPGNNWPEIATTNRPLSIQVWHHVAATYDRNNMRLYVDGQLVLTQAETRRIRNSGSPFQIGESINGGRFFSGHIDDVRIWNVARTQAQIRADMCTIMTGSETGLVAYYLMDDGVPSLITLDSTANSYDLTLTNMDPMTDWVPDFNCMCFDPTMLNATVCGTNVDLHWLTGGSDTWNLEWGPTGFARGSGTLIKDLPTASLFLSGLAINTGYDYYVQDSCHFGTNGNWIGPYTFTSGAPATGTYSLHFDGVDDYVESATPTVNFNSQITVEAWINADNFNGFSWENTIVAADNPANVTGFALRCGAGGNLSFKIGASALGWPEVVTTDTPLVAGAWHHVAATYDQAFLRLYIDGVEVMSQAETAAMFDPSINLMMGKSGFTNRFFTGRIDDVRIWSVALTQQQIQDNVCKALTGTEPGLEVYYVFDNGTCSYVLSDLGRGALTADLFNMDPQNDWMADDNCVCPPPSPTTLNVTNICQASADIFWTTGGANAWNIEWGPQGFQKGTGTVVKSITNNPYTLTGLSPGTTYSYYVRDTCSMVDRSTWAGPFSFTTLPVAATFYSLHFDGIDDQVNGPWLGFNFNSNITVEGWIKADSFPGTVANNTIISTEEVGAFNAGFALRCGNGGDLSFTFGSAFSFIDISTTGAPLSPNTWHHVAATYDNVNLQLFIDGQRVASQPQIARMYPSLNDLVIGASTVPGRHFGGRIDDLRLWTRALTVTELQDSACVTLASNSLGRLASWNFDDGTCQIFLDDQSPNNYTGILTNMDIISDWVPDDNCNIVLEEGGFTFELKERGPKTVAIAWDAPQLSPLLSFDIERLDEAGNYQVVGNIPFAPNILHYSFIDPQANQGKNTYRLKAVLTDGRVHYAAPQNILLAPHRQVIISPNPFEQTLQITTDFWQEDVWEVELLDALGRRVVRQKIHIMEGIFPLQLSIEPLPAGTYWLSIRSLMSEFAHYQPLIRQGK